MQFDDIKTTSADELEFAAIIFRAVFWLVSAVAATTAFAMWLL